MLPKIPLQRYILVSLTLFFFQTRQISAQAVRTGNYGIPVTNKTPDYLQSVGKDSAKKMIELRSLAPALVYDLRYSAANNFMHRRMYPPKTRYTFLRSPAAHALAGIQQELKNKGLGLKIFDAYRPYSVTVSFWELVKDERYVANPAKGSGHNRGLAIDLTIIELATKKELDMGTGFDNFTDTAHHSFTALPLTVLQNRQLLKEVMLRNGFALFETEWWHYSWPNDRDYEVLDIPFKELQALSK
jgi:D-alanyl-D-alanine dipeptidase